MFTIIVHGRPYNATQQTQKICTTFVQHCTNVIQMFCVCWVQYNTEELRAQRLYARITSLLGFSIAILIYFALHFLYFKIRCCL